MTTSDLTDAYRLSTAAGWNQTIEDWRMLLDVSPHGCFGIEVDSTLVATTTVVCYEKELAWIGMVLTKPEYRHRGFARRLLANAIERTDSMGIKTIKLDATEQGRPLYEELGFQPEQPVERWLRQGAPCTFSAKAEPVLNDSLLDLDRDAFVADRASLLRVLNTRGTAYQCSNGFLFTRPGRTANYIGPCVASDVQTTRQMIAEVIGAMPSANWSWDLLPGNDKVVGLAKEFGFAPQRHLTRMTRGSQLHGNEHMIYAIAGFELG